MQKAVLKEGPRAPLFYAAAALLLLSAKIATAQTVDLSTLELCAGLETQELKLACFEAIIAGSKTPAVDANPGNTPGAVVTSTAAVAAKTEPSAGALSVTSESSAVATAPEPVANSQLGEEHLERPETEEKANDDDVIHATVTEVSQGRNRTLYFHFDNGQVWRQTEARVRFLGHRSDVPELLAAADLFVFPSLFEGLPGAVIEAMALALPVVAADIPAVREVVEPGGSAVLVPTRDSAALAEALGSLLEDAERRESFGRRGREIFEERFTLAQSAEKMISFYRGLWGEAAGDGPRSQR